MHSCSFLSHTHKHTSRARSICITYAMLLHSVCIFLTFFCSFSRSFFSSIGFGYLSSFSLSSICPLPHSFCSLYFSFSHHRSDSALFHSFLHRTREMSFFPFALDVRFIGIEAKHTHRRARSLDQVFLIYEYRSYARI